MRKSGESAVIGVIVRGRSLVVGGREVAKERKTLRYVRLVEGRQQKLRGE